MKQNNLKQKTFLVKGIVSVISSNLKNEKNAMRDLQRYP